MESKIYLKESYFGESETVLFENGTLSASLFTYSTGVRAVRLSNERGNLVILPYMGQMVWRCAFDGRELTMKSIYDEPEAAKVIPIFRSGNMSLGISLLIELAKTTAANMPDANIEIVETHHNRKLDAPSGTALMIADAIRSVRRAARYVLGRSGQGKREDAEIGIHAIRMGNVVGTHEVIIGTDSQTITLKHEAHSRALFAEGALSAAAYLCGKGAGMYNMQSMIAEQA